MAEPITWTNDTRRLGDLVPWEHNPREINTKEINTKEVRRLGRLPRLGVVSE